MAITINDITLPDIPAEWLEVYPYALICKEVSSMPAYDYTSTRYRLILSALPFGYVSTAVDSELDYDMVIGDRAVRYQYDSTNDVWASRQEALDLGAGVCTDYAASSYSVFTSEILWWNSNIYTMATDANGDYIYTDTVYLEGSGVVEPPEKMLVNRTFFIAMAANIRRLRKVEDKMNPSVIESNMDSIPVNSKMKWLDEISKKLGDNDDYTVTSETDNIYVPSDLSLNFQYLDYTFDLVFPKATQMSSNVFQYSRNLRSFSAAILKDISYYGLSDCANLETLDLPALEETGTSCFGNCVKLASVNLPSLVDIGTYAFKGCTGLTEAIIPKCTRLGIESFSGCSALAKVDCAAEAIQDDALYNTAVNTLILRGTSAVCTLGSNPFAYTPIASGTGYIYVPSALVDSYKADSAWSTYAAQIRAIEDYPDICG